MKKSWKYGLIGAAAALAARARIAPSALDVEALKRALAEHGQIVPKPGLFEDAKRAACGARKEK